MTVNLRAWGDRAGFQNAWLLAFTRREGISDDALRDAVARAERGLIDADLGGGVIKQRVPRPGQGRSGGFRTLIAFKAAERSVFLFGFAKNDQDNIDARELTAPAEGGGRDVGLERDAGRRDGGEWGMDGGRR